MPIRRTRLRTADYREQRLGGYELFQPKSAAVAVSLGEDDARTIDRQL
jgi:hypothetical protein